MHIPHNHITLLKQYPSTGQKNQKKTKKQKDEALTKAEIEVQKTQINSVDTVKALEEAFDQLTTSQARNSIGLEKLIGQQEQLGKTILTAAQQSTFLEQRNRELNKTFKISSVSAATLGDRYDKIATSVGTGGKQIRKYAQELNTLLPLQAKNITENDKATGTMNKFGKQLLTTGKYFRENFGMGAESVQGFARFAATATDGAAGTEDILAQTVGYVAELEKVTGLVGTTEAILSGISNLSADVQLNFRRFPTDLGIAVLKARMLGTSLGEVFSIGKNLLNIEQSVGNELEYQLLSGKRLVNAQGESLTQKFREATLSGNASDSADALTEILESQGDVIKDNFFARKQLAETLGIGEDKLANMLQQRELLAKASADNPEAEKILKLQGDSLATAIKNYSVDGKEATDAQKEALAQLAENRANQMTTDEKIVLGIEKLTTAVIQRQTFDMGGSAAVVGSVQSTFTDPKVLENLLKQPQELFGATEKGFRKTLGALGQTSLVFGTIKDQLTAMAAPLGGFVNAISTATSYLQAAAFGGIDSLTATTVEAINIGTAGSINGGSGKKEEQDFISRPGSGIASFSSQDTVIGAKPGGPIDQMLASSTDVGSGTSIDYNAIASSGGDGGTSIDYNAMANAIASAGGNGGTSIDYGKMAQAIAGAIKNIQIVAPTDIYKDSSMNMGSLT